MNDTFEKAAEQTVAFQKMWMDSVSKMIQGAFTVTPNSPPPELLRQIRGGIFQAIAESWEEFMRSPQFLDGMRQWMDNAVTFRKMTNDFMAKVRNEMQAPSRDDIDTIMINVRHMEKRILDQMDQLSGQISELKQQQQQQQQQETRSRRAAKRPTRARAPRGRRTIPAMATRRAAGIRNEEMK